MARTKRNITHANINARSIRFKSQLTTAAAYVEELKEQGFSPRIRDLRIARKGYLDNRDDHLVSAYMETDFKGNKAWETDT
jgi:hypothetical protein